MAIVIRIDGNGRGKEVLVALVGTGKTPVAAITDPVIWFQTRFAKNSDYYNDPRGTSSWNCLLAVGPDVVPAVSVPTTITTPVGRENRFHNPVALRSHVPPVGDAATVHSG